MECPKCRRDIKAISPADLIFCPYCGENIATQSADQFSFCSSCGQKLPPESVFCPLCGKKMSATGTKGKVSPVAEVKKHTPSREDIAELVSEEAAEPVVESMPTPEPKSKPPGEPLWPRIVVWSTKRVEPFRDFVSGQWRVRRLYRTWAKDGVFSADEIPSAETLNQITKETGMPPYQPMRMAMVIVGLLILVAFFIVIGVTMSQCK